jgi:hypothetical protein
MRRRGLDHTTADLPELGHLEGRVMDILWTQGESSVQAVIDRLERPLAYTTVMTTLDRLFKKGLLNRRKRARAYSAGMGAGASGRNGGWFPGGLAAVWRAVDFVSSRGGGTVR